MIDFLCQIEILLWNMLKIQGFTRFFFSKFLKFQVYSGLLCLNCQIQGFVVTLFLVFISISLKLKVL